MKDGETAEIETVFGKQQFIVRICKMAEGVYILLTVLEAAIWKVSGSDIMSMIYAVWNIVIHSQDF